MRAIKHNVLHHYQPTNYSCSQTALSMLLSFFGQNIHPEEIMTSVPVIKDNNGKDWGTINQQLALWCIRQGYKVDMYTADFQIIDLSWAKLDKKILLEHMEQAKMERDIPSLGKELSQVYLQSYIDFVKADGKLHIYPYFNSTIIYELLYKGPILATVSYNVLHNSGRSTDVGLRKWISDDIKGKVTNHTIVIYGVTENGNFLIADPWKEPGYLEVNEQQLLCAMTAAQIECDNLLFQLSK